MAQLSEYRGKRNAARTAEPMPATDPPDVGAGSGSSFVIQEHHASALHWDFRLERDGVLVSWAIPKGIPPDPKSNHLAVHVEDHPLEYADFQGDIADGEYGGGHVSTWDRGSYDTQKWSEREVMVVLHGDRVQGRFVLFQTGGKNWMIHRMDAPQRPDWQPLPDELLPMRSTAGALPPDAGWAFEMKWDGARASIRVAGGRARVAVAGRESTALFPELRGVGEQLGSTQVLLDGALVAFDEDGRPSGAALQPRLAASSATVARRLAGQRPAALLLFDLLHLDGRPLLACEYATRRELLTELALGGPSWQVPPNFDGAGQAAVRAAEDQGLGAIVAKRVDSTYLAGGRSSDWISVVTSGEHATGADR